MVIVTIIVVDPDWRQITYPPAALKPMDLVLQLDRGAEIGGQHGVSIGEGRMGRNIGCSHRKIEARNVVSVDKSV